MELNKYILLKRNAGLGAPVIFKMLLAVLFISLGSCTISYKFNGSSIDYTKTKTLSIVDFPNNAELVFPPLAQEFSEKLRDIYAKQTRLQLLKKGGDMQIEGAITGYELAPMSISADGYAARTKITITIKVRFTNVKNPEDDFEKTYSAYQTFDSNSMLADVQDDLMKTMTTEIAESIYNDTVAKW